MRSQPDYEPPTPGWWRWALRIVAICVAVYALQAWTLGSWSGLAYLGQTPAAGAPRAISFWLYVRPYVEDAAVALIALGCLAAADGLRAVGLRPRLRWTGYARTTGALLTAPIAMMIVALHLFVVLLIYVPALDSLVPGVSILAQAPSVWGGLVDSALTAIAEEAVLLGVMMRVLDYVPIGHRGRLGRYTWAVVAILAAVRIGYHLYLGIDVIPDLVPMAIMFPLLYRRTGALVPFVVVHFCADASGFIPGQLVLLPVVATALLVVWAVCGNKLRLNSTPVRPVDRQPQRPSRVQERLQRRRRSAERTEPVPEL